MPEITGVPRVMPVCNCVSIPISHIHAPPQNGAVVPAQLAEVYISGELVAIITEQPSSCIGPAYGTMPLSSRSTTSIPPR